MELKQALDELRKGEKRKFDESVDLLISLKGIDMRKDAISVIADVPHKIKDKKICGFLSQKSTIVKTITKAEFDKYKDKKALKNLVKEYDFFIASAPLMPAVATTFGKVLGPTGKMPSPQLGVIMQENEHEIKKLLEKIDKSVKIRAREPSIKMIIGKSSMKDEDIMDNINSVYSAVVNALPGKKENIRKVMIKFTMSKPIKVEMK